MPATKLPLFGVAIATLGVFTSAPAAAQDSTIQVTSAVVATDVQEREPVGVAERFEPSIERVYFYNVLEGDFPRTELAHVWLREGEEVARVPLSAQGPRWRTWTSKAMLPEWTGDWEVQLVNADGEVLGQATFRIGAEDPTED